MEGQSDALNKRVYAGLGEERDARGEDLHYAAHVGAHDEQPAGGGLDDGDAERLGERAVEEHVATAQHVLHRGVRHRAEQLDAVVQLILQAE